MKRLLVRVLLLALIAGSMHAAEPAAIATKTFQIPNWPHEEDLRIILQQQLEGYFPPELGSAIKSVSIDGTVTYFADHPGAESLVHALSTFNQLVGSVGPDTTTGLIFLSLNVLLQASVFFGCCYLIYRLWLLIINALSGATDAKGKALLALLGGIDADAGMAAGKGKARLRGVGLLGTLAILAFGCIAIWLLGNHELRP